MKTDVSEIQINGVSYVPKDSANEPAEDVDGMEYVIVRTQSAGVFAGFMYEKDGQEVTLKNARRIWYWAGAASLSQLATTGTSKPSDCKFPAAVSEIILTQAIEILKVSAKAKKSIESVAVWQQ